MKNKHRRHVFLIGSLLLFFTLIGFSFVNAAEHSSLLESIKSSYTINNMLIGAGIGLVIAILAGLFRKK